jgi:virginiamycin B lyase
MRTFLTIAAAAAAAAALLVTGAAAKPAPATPRSAGYIYWTNLGPGTIGRANLDGTGVNQSFIVGAAQPWGVAVDAGHIYWGNYGSHTVGRANLDGTGVNRGFIAGAPGQPVDGVAVDAGHVYWTNMYSATIGRANLNGTGVNQSFVTASGLNLEALAADAGHVYWTDDDNPSAVGRANLDGTGVDQTFITGFRWGQGIAVDSRHLYWSSEGSILRANLDGTGVDPAFIPGSFPHQPKGVAVDACHVYWDDGNFTWTIGRANLDGTDVNPSFITGASSPTGIAVAPAAGVAGCLSLRVTPASLPADGVSKAVVTLKAMDGFGTPVVGDAIAFSSSDPGQSFGPVTDNGDGTYSTTVTSSTMPGTATITATDSSVAPSGTAQATLTQTGRPTVTSVAPSSGWVTGGTPVTITGAGFTPGASVAIGQGYGTGDGAIPATDVVVVSPTTITATTGGGAKPGSWNLFVKTPSGTSAISSGDLFTYQLPPRPIVSAVSPNWGPVAGGTRVTITGANFVAGAKVFVGQGGGTIGGAQAVDVVVVSPTQITATTGPATRTGNFFVYVKTAGGTSPAVPGVGFNYMGS